jgi:hypothetical protein
MTKVGGKTRFRIIIVRILIEKTLPIRVIRITGL